MTRANGSAYGWVIVAAGALMTCVSMGAMFSLAVFLQPISVDTGWSRTGISTAMTIDFLVMGFAAFAWGAMSDRFGPKIVVLSGSLMLGLGLVLGSRATSLVEFQLVFGILVGAAAGAFYAPMMALASGWIENNRSLAVALVSAGAGTAPLTVAPFARWLIDNYDWRPAMLVVGIVAWILLIPASFLVRRPPVVLETNPPAPGVATPVAAVVETRMSAGEALRTPQFAVLALAHFACCAAHSGPIFHMVTYAIGCGIPAMVAVSVYSLAGLSGLGGRVLLGVLADRLGAKPVLVGGLMVQALGAGAYLFARELGELYALSVVFGIAYGGVMPLYAILARDYFGPHIMGTVFGAISAMASLGMAFGPWAGGWVFDTYASYSWLYIGSFTVGLAAVAVAFTFKPAPAASKLTVSVS
ncbi:MFS transporter [Reyranella soli]|uniref:MFS transporter n=1 Tax=Reyranella soli TaxID=1230389 RepID=A0A512N5R7_9HYPH|nr:MFS transporter [Reyranella soli]GEP54320.1 MFS transporter [Reyranella soli]